MGDAMVLELTWDQVEKWILTMFSWAKAVFPKGYPWSPTLAEAGQRVTFWKSCFCSAKHCQDPFLRLIPSQLQHHGISCAGLSHAFYRSRLDDAWSHLHMVQDNSQELRKSFLLTVLSDAEIVGEKRGLLNSRQYNRQNTWKNYGPSFKNMQRGRSGLA